MNKYFDKTTNHTNVEYYVDVVSNGSFAHCSGIKVSFCSTYDAEGKIKRLTEHPEDLKLTVAYLNPLDNTCSLVICQNEDDVSDTIVNCANVWHVTELWKVEEKIVKHEKTLAVI